MRREDVSQDVRDDAARAMFEHSPIPQCQLTWPDHVWVAANGAYRAWLGLDDPPGLRPEEVFPEMIGQQWMEAVDRAAETRQPVEAKGWRIQLDHGDGIVEHFLDADFLPLVDADGRVSAVQILFVDRTEEHAAGLAAARATDQALQQRDAALATVETLQQVLLPTGVPVLPGVDLAATYRTAESDLGAGGDWFDTTTTDDGRVVLVVGDVVGHGVSAAAVMGQLRAVLIASLTTGAAPGEALAFLESYARSMRGARSTTAAVCVLDPGTGELEYCTAGHPPPLVVSAAGEGAFLDPSGAGPIGSGAGYPTRTHVLDPGDVVVLYSDGLVERPGRRPAESMVEILQVASDAVAGRGFVTGVSDSAAQRVCDWQVELLTRSTGTSDDITVLAAQRRRAPLPELLINVAAVPDAQRTVRLDLAAWCDELGVDPTDRIVLLHGAGELVANVVEHAYAAAGAGTDRPLVLTGALGPDGTAEVVVTDEGRWKAPSDAGRGRGIALARRLVDGLEVVTTEAGTTARMRQRLEHPAHQGTGRRTEAPRRDEEHLEIVEEPGQVRLVGAVDLLDTHRLGTALETAVSRLTEDDRVTVDLTGVTFFGSNAVQALFDVGPSRLRLVAPPGSPAHHVLGLVRVPVDPAQD